jgi:hypothetical protein
MWGCYVQRSHKQRIAEHFYVNSLPLLTSARPITSPSHLHAVVRLNRDTGERELVLMQWCIQLRKIRQERDRADRVTQFMTGMFEVPIRRSARLLPQTCNMPVTREGDKN